MNETPSTYTFDNIVNPTDTSESFAIRLSDFPSTDASGQLINLGSILSQINEDITIETQVPPQLIFCVGAAVSQDCTSITGGWYADMGTLDPEQTLRATSQMAVGTNASSGFVITANGTTLSAGTSVIKSLAAPTISTPGNSQFGIKPAGQ